MGARTDRATRILLALAATSGAGGCLGIAGNFDVSSDAEAGPAARAQAVENLDSGYPPDAAAPASNTVVDASVDAMEVRGDAACNPGQFQCAGPELQVCNPARDGWVNKELCGSAALCNAAGGSCTPTSCQKNDTQCQGSDLQICNDDLERVGHDHDVRVRRALQRPAGPLHARALHRRPDRSAAV